jgi:uncharacterized protein (DUF697 family)
MTRKEQAERIIRKHVLWSMAAAAIPLPVADVLGPTSIQMDMLQQLSALYKIDFSMNKGKAFLTSLVSSSFVGLLSVGARFGQQSKRRFGGWLANIILQGAMTYAIGQMYLSAYDYERKSPLDLGMDKAEDLFEEAFEKGKEYVEKLIRE